jgi:hypothetical protein
LSCVPVAPPVSVSLVIRTSFSVSGPLQAPDGYPASGRTHSP